MSVVTDWLKRRPTSQQASWPSRNGVVYIHHRPRLYNVGDDLCSPRNYFELHAARSGLVIMGGGAYGRFGLKYIRQYGYRPDNTVLWGVGESSIKNKPPSVKQLPFKAWGIRDRDRVPDAHFLPCVSCLHPMLSTSAVRKGGTLLFLNADPNVTDRQAAEQHLALANAHGWSLRYNNIRAAEMAASLAKCQRVITNSYHGAYWSLLTGHEVVLLGYSSKFSSLYRSMGLNPEAIVPIQRGDPASLLHQLKHPPLEQGVQLPNPGDLLDEFKARNLDFAEHLVEQGILSVANRA